GLGLEQSRNVRFRNGERLPSLGVADDESTAPVIGRRQGSVVLSGLQATGGRQQSGAATLREEVDVRRAAQSDRLSVADHLDPQWRFVAVKPQVLYRAMPGAHTAAQARTFERWARGRRAAEQLAFVVEDDLAVGADIDEHARLITVNHAARADTGHQIGADIRRSARQQ